MKIIRKCTKQTVKFICQACKSGFEATKEEILDMEHECFVATNCSGRHMFKCPVCNQFRVRKNERIEYEFDDGFAYEEQIN